MVCEGSVTPEFGNFIRTLADNDRLLLIPDIAELFEQYKAEHDRSISVEVESAFELTDDQQKTLRSEEHTSELQSRPHLVCRLLLEKKKNKRKLEQTTEQ